jgi:hypothetical protein
MANYCDYQVTVKGSRNANCKLVERMDSIIEHVPDSLFCEFFLHVDQLYAGAEQVCGHSWIGLEVLPQKSDKPVSTIGIDNAILIRPWCRSLLNGYMLEFCGESNGGPPVGLMEALSSEFPGLHFVVQGITEHCEFEKWAGTDGLFAEKEYWVEDIQRERMITWRLDGKDVPVDEWVSNHDPELWSMEDIATITVQAASPSNIHISHHSHDKNCDDDTI